MLPITENREQVLDHAREEIWTSIDHLTNSLQDCLALGDYPAAQKLGMIVNALWDLVKPVPEQING